MSCAICAHPKRQVIEEAIARGRRVGVVATQYRVEKPALVQHVAHGACGHADSAPISAPDLAPTRGVSADDVQIHVFPSIEQAPCRCELCQLSPYRLLKYAWEQASPNDRERLSAELMTPEWA